MAHTFLVVFCLKLRSSYSTFTAENHVGRDGGAVGGGGGGGGYILQRLFHFFFFGVGSG